MSNSASTTAMTKEFKNNLSHDGHEKWPELDIEIADACASTCAFRNNGLLSYYLEDDEWILVPGNANAQGVLQIQRPIDELPADLGAGAGAAAVAAHNRLIDQHTKVLEGLNDIKRRMSDAMGEDNCKLIRHARDGMRYLTIRAMRQRMVLKYGTANNSSVSELQARLSANMGSRSLEALIADHTFTHAQLAMDRNTAVNEFDKVKHFVEVVQADSDYAEAVRLFKVSNPTLAAQTFRAVSTFLEAQAPNFAKKTGGFAAAATATAPLTAVASGSTRTSGADLAAAEARGFCKGFAKAAPNSATGKAAYCYCYKDGYQTTHFGSTCATMAAANTATAGTFSPAQLGARTHMEVTGGSRKGY